MNTSDTAQSPNTFEDWNPDGFAQDAQYQRTIRTFTSDLISGDILDVGCGSRIFYSLEKANSWTGIDISERMLSSIEFTDKIENKKIMQGDVLNLPFEDGSFDTVTSCFLLHHLARNNKKTSAERVQKAFDEIFRVLRPDGRLIVAENCSGPVEAPYHFFFGPIYYLALKFFKTEMPYFWKPKHFIAFGKKAGFNENPLYIHVPIVESVYQPIAGFSTPAVLNGDLIQKMTVFEFKKAA